MNWCWIGSVIHFAVSFLEDSIFIPNTSKCIISNISNCECPNELAEQICKAMNLEEELKISSLALSRQVKIEHESSSICINQNKPNWSSLKQESNAHVSELTPKQESDRGKIYTNKSTLAVERPLNINGNEYQSGVCCQQEMKQTLQTIYQPIQNGFLEIRNNAQEMQQTLQRIEQLMSQNKQNDISETKDLRDDAHVYAGYLAVPLAVVFFVYTSCLKKTPYNSSKQSPENEAPKINLENSIAVVSFNEQNKDRHLRIARTVILPDLKMRQIYVNAMNNVNYNGEIHSKVCLVFVDKNDRDIILETEIDISKHRSSFVESLMKRRCTHVIVIYCQHEGSRELTTLYNRNLGNIKRQTTLQELQRQNRVLSIDDKFSSYQSNYLKLFINEILTK